MVGEVKGSGARNIQPAWRERVKCGGGGRKESAVNGQQSLGEEEEVEPRMDANERACSHSSFFFMRCRFLHGKGFGFGSEARRHPDFRASSVQLGELCPA